jgi:localization factor PodJL
MRPVPWHVKGVHPDARDVAREAARRSGVSVGTWLNSLIIRAADEDIPPGKPDAPAAQGAGPVRNPRPTPAADDHVAAIGRQIDELKWRIDSLSRDDSSRHAAASAAAEEMRSARLAEAVARIDRQLEYLSGNRRAPPAVRNETALQGVGDRGADEGGDASGGGAAGGDLGVDEALAEITARQHALDDEFAQPQLFDAPAAAPADKPTSEHPAANSTIERQLADIATQIKSLQGSMHFDGLAADLTRTIEQASPKRSIEAVEEQPRQLASQVEAARSFAPPEHLNLLRNDIADIGRRIADAMPPQAVAAIEQQVHGLTEEVNRLRPPLSATEIADALRKDFATLGNALEESAPRQAGATIEEQMRMLTAGIGKLFPLVRAEEIAAALRKDLAEIADTLKNALPEGALASLEQEVRALGARIEANRESLRDHPVIADIERSLGDLRDRLGAMSPLADIANLAETVKVLSHKADTIASQAAVPEGLHRLDDAIGALRGLAKEIASPAEIAGLSRDIQALAEKIDSSMRPDAAAMMTLDKRLAEMAAAFDKSRAGSVAIPADFEAVIKKLANRLESAEVRSADHHALKNLEGRIVGLVEKLDASEARLSRLDGVERGVGELLEQINGLRAQNENKLQAIQQELIESTTRAVSAPAEAIRRDVATLKELQCAIDRRTQDTFEAVYGTIEQVVDRLATIEEDLRGKDNREAGAAPAPAVRAPLAANPAPSPPVVADAPALAPVLAPLRDRLIVPTAETPVPTKPSAPAPQPRQPIVSDLPPDAPLKPGSGGRRIRAMASAIDRIAASEATAGGLPTASAETDPSVRAHFVAAARRAAQAVTSEQAGQPAARSAAAAPEEKATAKPPSSFMSKLGPRIKSLIVGISVIALVLGALRLAIDFFGSSDSAPAKPPASRTEVAPPTTSAPPIVPPTPKPAAPTAGKGAALGDFAPATFASAAASGVLDDTPRPAAPAADTTGSVPREAAPKAAKIQETVPLMPPLTTPLTVPQTSTPAPAVDPSKDLLPAAIGGKALMAAATAGDPAAAYEVASRFAEGKGVPQDLAMAAAWFDRAARRCIAPAQFRLGSMYEKGVGLKKDVQEARRLYLAAADKGNAKAMHNLAVLYAEGIDGKPEYAVATQWFRKAAAFGVVDSQYNLAILYARGVGIEHNMVESYKWFALAAKGGDKDAGKKSLEVASHLDEQQLSAARQSVETFVPEVQPEDAISAKAPGGWDQVVTAARKTGSASR